MPQSLMAVRLDPGCLRVGAAPNEFSTSPQSQLSTSPNWTIDVSDARTIKVTNISPSATADNIKEFFSFSGEIEYVEMRRESDSSQVAYVTFKEFRGADTALLLSGASISNVCVNITPVEDYELPPEAYPHTQGMSPPPTPEVVRKAEDVVSTMLARGFALSKDALKRAQSFDDRVQLLSTAQARVASLDRRFGLSQKFSAGTAVAREVDERFQVSELTRNALLNAQQRASTLVEGSPYASRGAAWVTAAAAALAKVAADVGTKTLEKVAESEGGRADGGDAAPQVQVDVPVHAQPAASRQQQDDDQNNKPLLPM